MNIPTVNILRAGAPEKVGLSGKMWNPVFHDNKNLRDINPDHIITSIEAGQYWLPSDENDYDFIQDVGLAYHDHILLCSDHHGRILPAEYVKKNSPFYRNWNNDESGIKYPRTMFYSTAGNAPWLVTQVYKSVNESGSRGVLINPSKSEFDEFINRHLSEPVIMQELVPKEYNKYFTFDLQIKEGKLLGFCFVNIPANSYPRWMSGYIINTEPIRKMINKFYLYLVNVLGIYNGFINCDGAATEDYSDFMMYEINWRYSGLGNCLRAFDIDIIQNYIYGVPYAIPDGEHPYSYYYMPILTYDKYEERY